ncbi:MAG: helix-hairpin-helix domain-containing protein [Phycisphaerales bacterium]|nr:MAG: helix-hairpin-helix domain-containing protein [Phycisphaerales bacterium]
MVSYHSSEVEGLNLRACQSLGFLVGTGLSVAAAACLIPRALSRSDEIPGSLVARVNPNTAPVASLARLPGIGWTRARAIITHRERVAGGMPETVAFKSLGDLQRIRGIGPMTAEGLAPWLRFD